jgi:hypothetical protein
MTEESKRPTLKLSVVKPNIEKLQELKQPIKYEKVKEEETPKSSIEPKYFVFPLQELGDLYKLVREKFPKAFPAKGEPPKILAIGIHKDLAEVLDLPIIKAKSFCRIYCRRPEYVEVRVKGAPRHDLNGTVVGEV